MINRHTAGCVRRTSSEICVGISRVRWFIFFVSCLLPRWSFHDFIWRLLNIHVENYYDPLLGNSMSFVQYSICACRNTYTVHAYIHSRTRDDRKVSDFLLDINFFGKDGLYARKRSSPPTRSGRTTALTSIGIYERFAHITPHKHSHTNAAHMNVYTRAHTLTHTRTRDTHSTRVRIFTKRFALWLACDPHASKRRNICFSNRTNWITAVV